MKKVVLLGGGHGLSNIVKGFKNESVDLTIIVSSSDDGGHTGKIRDEFDTVAFGDLRMVLNELIDENSFLKDVFDYRFDELHGVNGVSVGNLLIAALWMKYKDMYKIIEYFKEKEKIKANIFLSCDSPVTLCAICDNGDVVRKESLIGKCNKKIIDLYTEGEEQCSSVMLNKIETADVIVLCPGSLYTSVGAVLCVDRIKKSIKKSNAEIVYVCNVMCQNGETVGFSVEDHENALVSIIGKKIDRIIVNSGEINEEVLKKYKEENKDAVKVNEGKSYYEYYDLVEVMDDRVVHNSELTKKIILRQHRQNKKIML